MEGVYPAVQLSQSAQSARGGDDESQVRGERQNEWEGRKGGDRKSLVNMMAGRAMRARLRVVFACQRQYRDHP